MKSSIFSTQEYTNIARQTLTFLRGYRFPSSIARGGRRTVGDAMVKPVAEAFEKILHQNVAIGPGPKDTGDFTFQYADRIKYVVDVKTHDTNGKFSMPNLTSTKKLIDLYEDDSVCFALLIVTYSVGGGRFDFSDVQFLPIESIDWSCLGIGNLGWGQIQIKPNQYIKPNMSRSRKEWMLEFCDKTLAFYDGEMKKIRGKRKPRFEKAKKTWLAKAKRT